MIGDDDEHSALLERDDVREEDREVRRSDGKGRRPSARWIIPPFFLFSLLSGAASSVEMEIFTQIACRTVAARDEPLHLFVAVGGLGEGDPGWAEACRSSAAVQRETTRIITTVLLVAGTLSALIAAWWGALADRKGRKVVLFVGSASELLQAGIMLLILSRPERFGYGALLFLAAFAGLSGGNLASMAVASAYLGDVAGATSKAQLLSSYEAAMFAGLGLGPLLGSALISFTSLGPHAPYLLMVLFRAAYLAGFPLMPESLPPARRTRSVSTPQERRPLVRRLVSMPKELVMPFKVLLPRKVDEGKRKDWRLLLVAVSGALLLVDTGLGPVEVLYARAKFNWGPFETGNWLTYACAWKLVVLLGVMPLVSRWLKPKLPITPLVDEQSDSVGMRGRSERDEEERCAQRAKKVKAATDLRYDLTLARWTMVFSSLGYLVMLLPSPSVGEFLYMSAAVSIAAATPPALQSLALSLAGPEDAAKVLTCVSALATISTSTLGPSAFGAAYVATVGWWPELIFALAGAWMAAALVPLLTVRVGRGLGDEPAEVVDV